MDNYGQTKTAIVLSDFVKQQVVEEGGAGTFALLV
jgi:hypothetical protein